MKKMIAITIALVCNTIASGQDNKVDGPPCNAPVCQTTKFQYLFCDTEGHTVHKCSADPNNEPGLRPYKRSLPLEVCPINLSLQGVPNAITIVQYPPPSASDPGGPVFFRAERMEEMLMLAVLDWNSLCPPQPHSNEYQACCVKVYWANSISEMRGSPYAYANMQIQARVYTGPAENHTCTFNCDASQLVINRSPDFYQPLPDGTPRIFFLTEEDNVSLLPFDFQYVSARSILTHELGHWLGFEHDDERDDNGDICTPDSKSVMMSGDGWGGDKIRRLSPMDACKFMKLYCCEQTQRKNDSITDRWPPDDDPPYDGTKTNPREIAPPPAAIDFTVTPTPSISGILKFSLNNLALIEDPASIRFVDAAGNVVLYHQMSPGYVQEVALDARALPEGMYIVQFIRGGKATAKKIIIE